MKILVILGSPRKGNTYHTIQSIEKEMSLIGECEFEYIFLKQFNLQTCIGCSNCIRFGEEKCSLMDDRELLEQKLLNADGVIFGSPNYICNVSSVMKNFMDRFSYCGHRPRFFDKPAMLVCTSVGPGGLKQCMSNCF